MTLLKMLIVCGSTVTKIGKINDPFDEQHKKQRRILIGKRGRNFPFVKFFHIIDSIIKTHGGILK